MRNFWRDRVSPGVVALPLNFHPVATTLAVVNGNPCDFDPERQAEFLRAIAAKRGNGRLGHIRLPAAKGRQTRSRINTSGRRLCCLWLGCSRHRARARNEMNSTTVRHCLEVLCGRYGRPWLRPGYCWSSCDRCDRHRLEKGGPTVWGLAGRDIVQPLRRRLSPNIVDLNPKPRNQWRPR
jgi:hypothetical protein